MAEVHSVMKLFKMFKLKSQMFGYLSYIIALELLRRSKVKIEDDYKYIYTVLSNQDFWPAVYALCLPFQSSITILFRLEAATDDSLLCIKLRSRFHLFIRPSVTFSFLNKQKDRMKCHFFFHITVVFFNFMYRILLLG